MGHTVSSQRSSSSSSSFRRHFFFDLLVHAVTSVTSSPCVCVKYCIPVSKKIVKFLLLSFSSSERGEPNWDTLSHYLYSAVEQSTVKYLTVHLSHLHHLFLFLFQMLLLLFSSVLSRLAPKCTEAEAEASSKRIRPINRQIVHFEQQSTSLSGAVCEPRTPPGDQYRLHTAGSNQHAT